MQGRVVGINSMDPFNHRGFIWDLELGFVQAEEWIESHGMEFPNDYQITQMSAISEDGRMPEDWREEIARLGTSWQKPYLEHAPWIVVLFEQRFGVDPDGTRSKHYYVKESVGIACGLFISALHRIGRDAITVLQHSFVTRVAIVEE